MLFEIRLFSLSPKNTLDDLKNLPKNKHVEEICHSFFWCFLSNVISFKLVFSKFWRWRKTEENKHNKKTFFFWLSRSFSTIDEMITGVSSKEPFTNLRFVSSSFLDWHQSTLAAATTTTPAAAAIIKNNSCAVTD